jgi:uncharacterized protein DUF397
MHPMPFDDSAVDAPEWRRASRCTSGGCVEVAITSHGIIVRDSKIKDSSELTYTPDEWRVFIEGVKSGEFDIA